MGKEEKAWLLKDWKVYPELNLIQNHQSELMIKPRLMKLLTFFLLHQNQVVTKEDILDFVWEDRIVTENLLTKSISELRKILEEYFSEQLVIETIRNVGYRLNTSSEIRFGSIDATAYPSLEQNSNSKRGKLVWGFLVTLGLIAVAVFTRGATPDEYIYRVEIDRITSLQGQETSPVVSPDGKNIAFTYRKKPGDNFHIYLKALEENTPRRLSESLADEFNPCWSPDGASLVFMRSDSSKGLQLIKKSIIGSDEQVLTQLIGYTSGRDLLWLATENQLVFSAKKAPGSPYCLYTYDLKKAKLTQLTQPPEQSFGDLHPVYVAKRSQLAFIRVDDAVTQDVDNKIGKSVLNIIDLKTGEIKPVTVFEKEVRELAYHSPSEQHLCWLSAELTDNQLVGIDNKGNKTLLHQLKNGLPSKGSVGPDHAFYYELWSSNLNVHQYELETTHALSSSSVEYLNSTLLDWGVRFAANADRMVFLSYRSGYKEIWISSASQPDNAYQLTRFENYAIQSASISPDGKYVVFLVKDEQEIAVYTIQANGEGLKKISKPTLNYTLPEWMNDSGSIYFGSTKAGQWDIWKKELATGKETLLQAGGYAALAAPVGRGGLYYASLNLDTFFHFDPVKRISKPVLSVSGVEAGNWAITTAGTYYLTWESGKCQLVFYDFKTQLKYPLRQLENIIPGLSSLAVSPGGDYLFLAQADEIGADLMRLKLE